MCEEVDEAVSIPVTFLYITVGNRVNERECCSHSPAVDRWWPVCRLSLPAQKTVVKETGAGEISGARNSRNVNAWPFTCGG